MSDPTNGTDPEHGSIPGRPDDAASKGASFTVKGAFDPSALVKAVNAAGYHVKLDKADVIKPTK